MNPLLLLNGDESSIEYSYATDDDAILVLRVFNTAVALLMLGIVFPTLRQLKPGGRQLVLCVLGIQLLLLLSSIVAPLFYD